MFMLYHCLIWGKNKTDSSRVKINSQMSDLQEMLKGRSLEVCLGASSEIVSCPSSRHTPLWCQRLELAIWAKVRAIKYLWLLHEDTPLRGPR